MSRVDVSKQPGIGACGAGCTGPLWQAGLARLSLNEGSVLVNIGSNPLAQSAGKSASLMLLQNTC